MVCVAGFEVMAWLVVCVGVAGVEVVGVRVGIGVCVYEG